MIINRIYPIYYRLTWKRAYWG